MNGISEKLISTSIENIDVYSEGRVISYADNIILVDGLETAKLGEIVHIYYKENDVEKGIVFNLEENKVGVVLLKENNQIRVGNIVRTTGTIFSVKVSKAFLGRVLNVFCEPIDNLGTIKHDKNAKDQLVERKAYGVIERESVKEPLQTGIISIDALIPIGRGQRELIIGDRQTGKTSLALDIIINQAKINEKIEKEELQGKKVYSIYVGIGQKLSKVVQVVQRLKANNALKYCVIISASASEPATAQYLAPFVGTAIGEFFMENGDDALIVYDDLTKQAKAYRQISLLLKRAPGREAYPGDIFYLHSRLLERSAKLNKNLGGGSLTSLPIIETQAGDISAYIPTNVISITDGQIYLKTDLFNSGIRPAIDIGNSVSRVGGSAQIKAMKQVAGTLKLNLAQFRELQTFVQFGIDVDESTKEKINQGLRLSQILKQKLGITYDVAEQIVIIWGIINKYADNIDVEEIQNWKNKLLDFLRNYKSNLLNKITQEQKITPEIEEELKITFSEFKIKQL